MLTPLINKEEFGITWDFLDIFLDTMESIVLDIDFPHEVLRVILDVENAMALAQPFNPIIPELEKCLNLLR